MQNPKNIQQTFKRRKVISSVLLLLWCIHSSAWSDETDRNPLPSEKDFAPSKYLGKWFEIARMPTQMQPANSLATAEYSLGEGDGMIVVKNTAYDAAGNVAQIIKGKAKLAEEEPKGRLLVSFGPVLPSNPNYCVLRVDKDYKIALVGSPDRNSLWILSRDISVPRKRLERLTALAQKSGYDTSKLIYAKWPESFSTKRSKEPNTKKADLTGNWIMSVRGPNGEMVEFPMELKVDSNKITGRVGRSGNRWMELRNGKIENDTISFILQRDRPESGSMTYHLTGKFSNDQLKGDAKTSFNGNEVTSPWNAIRTSK